MLRKGQNHPNTLAANRRAKTNEHLQVNSHPESNKENLSSKSLFENIGEHELSSLSLKGGQSNYGSTMVSPTFQSNTLVSLKEDVFRQNKGYVEVNLKLNDFNKKNSPLEANQIKETEHRGERGELSRQMEEERQRLVEHYKSKKYWSKIEKLFAQEGVDAVLAWQDSIEKYSSIKNQNTTLRQSLGQKEQLLSMLQQQLEMEKNETRIVSQKKCKDCERLQAKEKEYFQLYQQFKKQGREIKERQEEVAQLKKALAKTDEKYQEERILKEEMQKKRALLKQDLQKKTAQLNQKDKIEKQLTNQILKLQSGERSNSKKLHIECEQLKEFKYQAEKTISKVDEKYKKELTDLQGQYAQLTQQKVIYEEELAKTRQELNEVKPKVMKYQFQLQTQRASLAIKMNECEQLRKRHVELFSEEKRKNVELQSLLKQKEEELAKIYQLVDEGENSRGKMEMEICQERKINEEKDQEINRYIQIVRDLQSKTKEQEYQYQDRNKDFCQLYRTKNAASSNSSSSPNIPVSQVNLNRKTSVKIREIYLQIKKMNEQQIDSLQRRRLREDESEERQSLTPFQVEKYINEIHTDISNVMNKCIYLHNENIILKEKMDNEQEESEVEIKRTRNQLVVKEQTLRAILSFIPDELKDSIVDLLQITETLGSGEYLEETEEEYHELKGSVETEGRQWREHYNRIKFKFRKMEDDLHRLEEQNEELKRRTKTKESKRVVVTDYDYNNTREGVTKKDIRKKYNFDN